MIQLLLRVRHVKQAVCGYYVGAAIYPRSNV